MNSEHSTALIIGANSAIAGAISRNLLAQKKVSHIIGISRQPRTETANVKHFICSHHPDQITAVVDELVRARTKLVRVFICTGLLHDQQTQPEKTLQSLQAEVMLEVFRVNCVIPAMWIKALLPLLKESHHCIVTAFSARVGSITDNHKGGWHSYRASKAALNMTLKSAALEYARLAPNVKLLSFHPGTVDTPMSRPFQKHVPAGNLLTPDFVANRLITITDSLVADGTLSYLDWQGNPIPW